MDDTWIRSETLGKSKEFFWKIDKDHNLYTRRKFSYVAKQLIIISKQ